MTAVPSPLASAGWAFGVAGGPELATAVSLFLEALGSAPELLALGEPTHGEPAFPTLRNRVFEVLVDRGFRSIAVESDCVAALRVDAFVRGDGGTLDSAMTEGVSHGFGQLDANRELVAWMRAYNDSRPDAERLAFYGFDAPLEMTGAPSPRRYLEHVHGYLAEHLGSGSLLHRRQDLERLLGDDERWSDPAALLNATKSIGASPDAAALRVIADDLLTALHVRAPGLVAASSLARWHHAETHATAALGLLRYHAQAAETAPQAERTSRMLGVRDALMAGNLLAIHARERHRGPTLLFAHNRHLQRQRSTWRLADMDLEWFSAGAIVATLLGERYAFIASSLGASAALGLHAPPADTFESPLQEASRGSALFETRRLGAALDRIGRQLHARTDVTAEQGYFPLDAETLWHCDGVLHLSPPPGDDHPAEEPPTPAELAARILALPDVSCVIADEQSGAPEIAWGDRFFSLGSDRLPFATIVEHDYTGFDEDSRLDRPGIFRLNVELGRDGFEREFGYPPAEFAARRSGIDFAALDEILPHPLYATQGWACILNPGVRRLPDVDRLVAHAHGRALSRRRR